jgi:peptidyl-prolyl cis-trans isomerase D
MTMLNSMRRHQFWLKWILALVVVTFIWFYVPVIGGVAGNNGDTVAKVEGEEITVRDFQRQLNQRMQMFRGNNNVSPQMLKQLGIDQQVLQEMIDDRATIAEAEKRGLRVTDAEVREAILHMPGLQENGQFVGEARYRALLRMQRPPMSPEDFENLLRRELMHDKLQQAVTGWITISDTDVESEYRRRNEKVKLDVVAFSADAFKQGLTATDDELNKQFEANKEKYRIGEKRKVRYLQVDINAIRAKINPTPQEIEAQYNQNIEQYSTPEQVHALHILLKTEGKDEAGVAAVKKQAEDVLKQAKSGADFGALAKKYSEDEGSKDRGGDLNFFGKGQMVPEFEQVAFSLPPGQISDLVKTQFGFHIIKVLEKKAPTVQPLNDVKASIAEQLKFQRSQAQATQLATKLASEIKTPADLDKVAKQEGLTVKESNFFTREEPVSDLGPSPQVASEAFTLKDGQVSDAIRLPGGYAFITVTGKQDSYIPKLDVVKEKVRADVITKKAVDAAKAKAAELEAKLKGGTPSAADFAKAAKDAGREVKSTEMVARGSVIPDAGISPAVDSAAFSLPTGAVSGVIATDNGAVIVRVADKTAVTEAELKTAKDSTRKQMLSERQNRFFSSYMERAKDKMKIEIYRDTLQKATAA